MTWPASDTDGTWVVLDAKYRVRRSSETEAFTSLHLYRDGPKLRGHGGRPRAGPLLVPEIAGDCTAWAEPDFLADHGLGLWRLRPGVREGGALGRWVRSSLAVPEPAAA